MMMPTARIPSHAYGYSRPHTWRTSSGIAIGIVLAVGGLSIGPIHLKSSSLWIPTLIIGVVYTPYMARPLRGEVLALREKEFIEAAVAQGAGPLRIPNMISTIVVFFTLNIANSILLEATLSFLGAGVQPPNSSWGTMISEGFEALYSQPILTIIPGTASSTSPWLGLAITGGVAAIATVHSRGWRPRAGGSRSRVPRSRAGARVALKPAITITSHREISPRACIACPA